jgi:hypothetical protein
VPQFFKGFSHSLRSFGGGASTAVINYRDIHPNFSFLGLAKHNFATAPYFHLNKA